MKAFIMAAGLGTRLKPFTLTNPKALVPVGGVPMLEHVIRKLKSEGFNDIVINVHHFADKIEEFVISHDNFGLKISFSNERDILRDTGGAIRHARELLSENSEPFLVHNVDILSSASLSNLMRIHKERDNGATLLVSNRNSSRKLIFDKDMQLCGWHNLKDGIFKPAGYSADVSNQEFAFSGIHVLSPEKIFLYMDKRGYPEVFSIIDFYLDSIKDIKIEGSVNENLRLIDIGKPETLKQANELLINNEYHNTLTFACES